jgi:hypothetical protein
MSRLKPGSSGLLFVCAQRVRKSGTLPLAKTGGGNMYRREYKVSRLRNWLALLLMAVAAVAAGRTQASEVQAHTLHEIVQR